MRSATVWLLAACAACGGKGGGTQADVVEVLEADGIVVDATVVPPDSSLCINLPILCEDACDSGSPSCRRAPYHASDWCCPFPNEATTLPVGALCSVNADAGACDPDATCLPVDPSAAVACDDGNPCTADILSADARSCSHAALADNVPCATNSLSILGYCFGGQCQKLAYGDSGNVPDCATSADCAASVPADSCAAAFGCFDLEGCQHFDRDPFRGCLALGQTACPPPADTCQRASCQQKPNSTGWGAQCVTTPAPDGALCDDGNPATGPDVCKGGMCNGK